MANINDPWIDGPLQFNLACDLLAAAGKLPKSVNIHPSTWYFYTGRYAPCVDLMGVAIKLDSDQPVNTTWYKVFEASCLPSSQQKPAIDSNIFTSLLDAWKSGTTLPTDSASRKLIPVHSGFVAYFPAAMAAIAAQSLYNNRKHNEDGQLCWDQSKSKDQSDCLMRHLLDRGDAVVSDDILKQLMELTAECWRKLAELQLFAQNMGAPKPPAAK